MESPDPLVVALSTAPLMTDLPSVADPAAVAPPNPPAKLQEKFVGRSFEDAYTEALTFVKVTEEWSAQSGLGDLKQVGRVLDFGCGWGRISRVLIASGVDSWRLIVADVDQSMLAVVNASLPGVHGFTVDALPPTVLADQTTGLVTAFSVFSHLAAVAHEAWAGEFGRLVADGGLVVITVLDEALFQQVRWARADGASNDFADIFGDRLEQAQGQFDDGGFAYSGAHPDGVRTGDFYGWAAASKPWVERVWGAAGFDIVQWVPSNVLFPQAAVALRRRHREDPPPPPRQTWRDVALRARSAAITSRQDWRAKRAAANGPARPTA
jgi:SAM-dependent methyltransferase